MRHYYRFMELEPVMEMEEDSVGEESPTSSTGSPSFSPPPDVWAQLTGKDYHDSVYNLLLQDHLDLQRAYRVLEVQCRNCEKRAGRDATESAAQVRALKDTLKEVLTTQESDRMAAIKEEMHRVKEREKKMKEEVYDLREQNELLEFRILELEECQENQSTRGTCHDTRDVGTDMREDGDRSSLSAGACSKQQGDASVSTPVPPDSTLEDRYDVMDKTTCHETNLHNNEHENICTQSSESNMAPHGDRQHSTVTAQSTIDHKQSTTNPRHDDNQDRPRMECTSVEPICSQLDTTPGLPNFYGAISCNLCRRLPRRKSLTEGVAVVGSNHQRETLRKSKSDGEIKKRIRAGDEDLHGNEIRFAESLENDRNLNENNNQNIKIKNEDIASLRRSGDYTEMTPAPAEIRKSWGISADLSQSVLKEDGQLVEVKSMLRSIGDILKETRIEVECTNSELREEVVTLEDTVICLMGELKERGGSAVEVPQEHDASHLRGLFQRHNSLTSSKECQCCSEVMRPALEDVIVKLQQLADMVDNAALTAPFAEVKTIDVDINSTAEGETDTLEAHVDITETPVAATEVQIKEVLLSPEEEYEIKKINGEMKGTVCNVEVSVVCEGERNEVDCKENNSSVLHEVSETKREYFKSSKAIFEIGNHKLHLPEKHIIEETLIIGKERLKNEVNNNILVEVPLTEDTCAKQKPVLRRWMEHLTNRQERAKSKKDGVDLTCSNRLQPTTVN